MNLTITQRLRAHPERRGLTQAEVRQEVSVCLHWPPLPTRPNTFCGRAECFKCGEAGHWASACPNEDNGGGGRSNRGSGKASRARDNFIYSSVVYSLLVIQVVVARAEANAETELDS